MRVPGAPVLLALLLLAGCLGGGDGAGGTGDSGRSGTATPTTTSSPSAGPCPPTWTVTPDPLVLTPGQVLSIDAVLRTPCPVRVTFPCHAGPDEAIRVGTHPLLLSEAAPDPPLPAPATTCSPALRRMDLPAGGEHRASLAWNGSFVLWDHRDLEPAQGGDGTLRERTLWAAAGTWPVHLGWPGAPGTRSEPPAAAVVNLTVAEDARNADSPLRPGLCQDERDPDAPRLKSAAVRVEPASAPRGTVVTLRADYVLDAPRAGCWLLHDEPQFLATDAGGTAYFGFHAPCPATATRTLVVAEAAGDVAASLVVPWDGTGCTRSEPARGATEVSFLFPGAPGWTRATMTWT